VPADFLQHDRKIGHAAACATIFGRQNQTEPALFRERLVRFSRRTPFVVARRRVLRRAYPVEELAHVVAQRFLLG
jgi:hypothetical protein